MRRFRADNYFLILNGSNGATFIINTKSFSFVLRSLKFFKARTFRTTLKKIGLIFVSFLVGKLYTNKLKTPEQIELYLNEEFNSDIDFGINEDIAVLISPTRDKVIVNHKNRSFQKFAFGESYSKVKKEATIYSLFKTRPRSFQISELQDFTEIENKYCSFILNNNKIQKKSEEKYSLAQTLVEFFQVSQSGEISVHAYIDQFLNTLENLDLPQFRILEDHLSDLKLKSESVILPLGLVHNDFKTWNVIRYDKILIFDFEEADLQGMPMFDLFNFYCDPNVRYISAKELTKTIFSQDNIKIYQEYLRLLKINLSFVCLLDFYLIERILFWHAAKEQKTATDYLGLFKFIHSK
jgi:hypothetical protein